VRFDPGAFAAYGGLDVGVSGRTAASPRSRTDPASSSPPAGRGHGWTVGAQLPVETVEGTVYFTIVGSSVTRSPPATEREPVRLTTWRAPTSARQPPFLTTFVLNDRIEATVEATAGATAWQAVPVSVIAADRTRGPRAFDRPRPGGRGDPVLIAMLA